MTKLSLDELIEYGLWFIKQFYDEMECPFIDDLFDNERAKVAVQKIYNNGLAVVPCSPDELFMESPFLYREEGNKKGS